MTSGTKRSRARGLLSFSRGARSAACVLSSIVGCVVMFVVAAVGAVLLHLDLPATRRLISAQVNGVLASTLAGTVEIEHVSALGLRGIDGVRVRVRDPEGVQVLHVDGVGVRIRSIDALRSALSSQGPIVIDVPSASVGNADVNLDADPSGQLRLVNAFAPRRPSEPPAPNEPPGRGVRVDAPLIRLAHAWAHGTPSAGAPRIDAELVRPRGASARRSVDRAGRARSRSSGDARAAPSSRPEGDDRREVRDAGQGRAGRRRPGGVRRRGRRGSRRPRRRG